MMDLQENLAQPSQFSQRPQAPLYSPINPNASLNTQLGTYAGNMSNAYGARSNPALQSQADSVINANSAWQKGAFDPYKKAYGGYTNKLRGLNDKMRKRTFQGGGDFEEDPFNPYGSSPVNVGALSPEGSAYGLPSRSELFGGQPPIYPNYNPGSVDTDQLTGMFPGTPQGLQPQPPRREFQPYGNPGMNYSAFSPQGSVYGQPSRSTLFGGNAPKVRGGPRFVPTTYGSPATGDLTQMYSNTPRGLQPPRSKRKFDPYSESVNIPALSPEGSAYGLDSRSTMFGGNPPKYVADAVAKAAADPTPANKAAANKAITQAGKASKSSVPATKTGRIAANDYLEGIGKNPIPTTIDIKGIPKGLRKGEKLYVSPKQKAALKMRGFDIGDYKGDIAAGLGTIANQIMISKLKTKFDPETVDLPRNSYTDRRQEIINQNNEQFRTASQGIQNSSAQDNLALRANIYAKSLAGTNQALGQEQQREDVLTDRYNERLNRTKAFNTQIRNYGKEVTMNNKNQKIALTQANIDNLIRSYQGNEAMRAFTQTEHGKNFLSALASGETGVAERYLAGQPERLRRSIGFKAEGGIFKKGGIYIKPKNRGKFNALKKRTGKTTAQLKHSKNPLTRKRATFAANAKKWKHKGRKKS